MRRIAFLLLLIACSENGALSPGEYDDALVDARCAYLTRCGLFPDRQVCARYYEHVARDSSNLLAAVEAGKVTYDEAAAKECRDAIATRACDARFPEVCNRVFTAQVVDGAACAFDAECISQRCDVPGCAEACCTGTCVTRYVPAIGQSCRAECEEGAFCGAFDLICHALVAEGQPCNDPVACGIGFECAGLYSQAGGVCRALPQLGEPCETRCAAAGVVCAVGGTCSVAGLPGDPCMRTEDCSEFYRCNFGTNTCAEQPMLGEACTSLCTGDAWCNGSFCEAEKPDGSPCLSFVECASRSCNNEMCGPVPLCI